MSNLPDIPPGVEEEGMAAPRKVGRPRNKPPMGSVLNVIKGIEAVLRETGELDFSIAKKQIASYSAVSIERGLTAADKEIPLKLKVDWALRTGPVIAMLDSLIPKDAGKGFPKTEAAIDEEIKGHFSRMGKLLGKNQTPDTQAILDTLAPQAKNPPESA
jgi:hypothetical protein